MYLPYLKFIALPVPEIIAIAVLGWGCEPQSWGRGGRMGSGMYRSKEVTSYRPCVVTFHVSLRVSEILPLLCSSTPLFPTPHLVSPIFPHVPLRVDGWRLGCEQRRCWANCPLQLVSKISNLCDPDSPTLQTDGETTCNLSTALCTIVHRAVKATDSGGI